MANPLKILVALTASSGLDVSSGNLTVGNSRVATAAEVSSSFATPAAVTGAISSFPTRSEVTGGFVSKNANGDVTIAGAFTGSGGLKLDGDITSIGANTFSGINTFTGFHTSFNNVYATGISGSGNLEVASATVVGQLTAQGGLALTGNLNLSASSAIKVNGVNLIYKDTDNSTYTGSGIEDAYGGSAGAIYLGNDATIGDYVQVTAGANGAILLDSTQATFKQGVGAQLAQVKIDGSTRDLTLQGKDNTIIKTTTAGGNVQISGSTITSGSLTVGGTSTLVGGTAISSSLSVANGATISLPANSLTGSQINNFAVDVAAIAAAAALPSISGAEISGAFVSKDASGNVTISGDLTVNGTTTTINSTILTVDDYSLVLGNTASPTDSTADGGGVFLSGSTVKSFQWSNGTDSWTSSENLDLASGKTFKIATVDAVKQTTFSQEVENGQYNVAITGSQLVSGSSTSFVGVGAGSLVGMGSIGDVAVVKGNAVILNGGGIGLKLEASGSGMGGITIGAYGDGETITLTGSAGSVTLSQLVSAVGGGTGVTKSNYYSARNSVVAHNNSGSTNDVIFHFYLNPAAPEGQFSGENWEFHRITGLSGSTEADCLDTLGYASIDVMTRDNGAANWTNDLVSVKVEASSSSGTWYPKITVSAPALVKSVNTKIRLIVINDKSGSIG